MLEYFSCPAFPGNGSTGAPPLTDRRGVILLHELLLALRYRARRISLVLLFAYVSVFCMLSLAHTCESASPRRGDGTPAHAHRLTAPGVVDVTPTHDCLA